MSKKTFINENALGILSSYLSDYNRTIHGRGISRMLKMNQKTVSTALAKLNSLGILECKESGKNLEYGINLGNTIAKHYLVGAEAYKTISFLKDNFEVKSVMDSLKNNKCFEGIALIFGSFAAGTFGEESDVDVFVIGKVDESCVRKIKAAFTREVNIKSSTKKQFELALRKKDSLAAEIVKTHIITEGIDNFIDILWSYFNEVRQA